MRTISELYDKYAKMIYFTAYGVCHSGEIASDVLQIVFLRVVQHEHMVMALPEQRLRGWLCKVARNAAIDAIKKNARELPCEKVEPQGFAPGQPEETCIRKYENETLMKAVERLPHIYRAPIELCYFAELSGREAAKVLGIKESTLRSRLLRGKAMLQSMLDEEVDGNGQA